MSWTAPDLWQWRWWGRVAGVQRSFTAPSQRGSRSRPPPVLGLVTSPLHCETPRYYPSRTVQVVKDSRLHDAARADATAQPYEGVHSACNKGL